MATSYHDIAVPTITEVRNEEDLRAFHSKHFPGTALPTQFFLSTGEDETQYYDEDLEDEDDDGLGYYSDGVKRTLTDTQISIFRHSEVQRILWREAGEYSGPIFPGTSARKTSAKSRSSKQNRKASTKDAKPSSQGTQDAKKPPNGDIAKAAAAAAAGPQNQGSNLTPATAPKRKRNANKKNNRKKSERSAARGWKSKEERARTHTQSHAQARRGNTSSVETEEQEPAIKKAKTAGKGKVEDVRHNPEDFKEEGEDFTFRRMARDEDDADDVAVELDY